MPREHAGMKDPYWASKGDAFPPVPEGHWVTLCSGSEDCVLASLGDGRYRVVHAEPVIKVAGLLMRMWSGYGPPPGITLKCDHAGYNHLGDVIAVDCEDRCLVYRIHSEDFRRDVYEASWPD